MSEWTENSIGEILEHIADNRGKNPQSYCEMGVPVIDNYLITSDWRIDLTKTKRCIDAETYDSFIRKHIKEDDVLVTLVGNGYGSVAITPKEKCVIIQNTIGFRCNSDNDNKFLYYLLKGNRESLMNLNIGAAQPSIKVGNLLDLSFEFPSLPEQKAIANILGSLDDKIELNRKMNETLEGMAQALFKSWFVDFDPVIDNILVKNLKEYYSKNSSQEYPSPPPLPEGEELTDAKSLSPWERLGEGILYNGIPEEFRDRAEVRLSALRANAELGMLNVEIHNSSLSTHHSSLFPSAFRESEELGWIPEGWEARPLTKIFDINPSVKLSKGTVAPFADMKALPTKGYAIEAFIEKAYSGGAKFQNEDVLLARITPCLENGKTGIVDFLSEKAVGFGSTEFIVLRRRGEIKPPFVACLAREENFRLHCIQSMVGSSGRQRVQNACFESFYLAIPSEPNVLKKFSEIASPKFRKSSEQSKEVFTLAKLRDTLLPKLISGELQIEDAEKIVEEARA